MILVETIHTFRYYSAAQQTCKGLIRTDTDFDGKGNWMPADEKSDENCKHYFYSPFFQKLNMNVSINLSSVTYTR